MAVSKDNIAVANPIKPEIFLLDYNLNIIDTIEINYPKINETTHFIDSLITDDYIAENKSQVYKIINKLNANNIMRHPRIDKIAFVNNDLLYIHVMPEYDSTDVDWNQKAIHYVYSLSQNEFCNPDGLSSYYYLLNGSAPVVFNGNRVFGLDADANDDDSYVYNLNITKLTVDFGANKTDVLTLSELPKFSDFKDVNNTNIALSYDDFDYVMFADASSCSHCRYGNVYPNILVVHTIPDGEEMSKATKMLNVKKFAQVFNNPKVLFCTTSVLNGKQIGINKIYRIEK